MVRPSLSALLLLAVRPLSAAAAANRTADTDLVPDGFIIECESSQAIESVAQRVRQKGGKVRETFESDVFQGLSVQLGNGTTGKDREALLDKTEGVKGHWAIHSFVQSPGDGVTARPDAGPGPGSGPREKQRRRLARRASQEPTQSSWTHGMTQIDKLHAEGRRGKGIKIAIIDTGVDYRHPALGGCLGPGCRVALGRNFVDDQAADNPMDCDGHGTMVAGIAAGSDADAGFVGAAPEATLLAYRTSGCSGPTPEDALVQALLRAQADGAHVVNLSLGKATSWSQSAVAVVAARVVAGGVAVVAAVGNERWHGLFNADAPSTGAGVVSVASFALGPGPGPLRGEFSTAADADAGPGPGEFVFRPGEDPWDAEERLLHDVDAEYGDGPDDDLSDARDMEPGEFYNLRTDCRLSPGGGTKDLVGKVVLVRQNPVTHGCNYHDRVTNALGRGAAHVLAWHDDARPLELEMGWAVRAIGYTDADAGRAMARAAAEGRPVKMRSAGPAPVTDGVLAEASASGPNWDLDVKPNLGAPGHNVRAPSPGGAYASVAGTSFATPLVAGVVALVAEARGVRDPAVLESLIVAAAEPQTDRGTLVPVAHQGGGLLRALDAAHATTLVEPSRLAFNDTDHRVQSIRLRISNMAETDATYRISSRAAPTLYTQKEGSPQLGRGVPVEAEAAIQLSQDSVTVKAGQSASIEVSATDPPRLDAKRLPIWSGWIAVEGPDGKISTVPYLGLAGSLRSALVLDPGGGSLGGASRKLAGDKEKTFVLPDPSEGITNTSSTKRVEAAWDLALGTSELRVDIVPMDVCSSPPPKDARSLRVRRHGPIGRREDGAASCVPSSLVTEFAGVKSLGQVAGYPKSHIRARGIEAAWDGSLEAGGHAPPGRYKLVARALSIMGDAGKDSDWQGVELGSKGSTCTYLVRE